MNKTSLKISDWKIWIPIIIGIINAIYWTSRVLWTVDELEWSLLITVPIVLMIGLPGGFMLGFLFSSLLIDLIIKPIVDKINKN